MYIDVDDYPSHSGARSQYVWTNNNAHIWCDHGFPKSKRKGNILTWINMESWEITPKTFPENKQVNKYPTATV